MTIAKLASHSLQLNRIGSESPITHTATDEDRAVFQQESLREKEKGNASYKAKQFEDALLHYDNAIKLDSENMSFYTNKAGTNAGSELSGKTITHYCFLCL